MTSSSFEVFAALALNDEQHKEHMCVPNPSGEALKYVDDKSIAPHRFPEKAPNFYKKYVQAVIEKIEHNARLEFDCIWRENERTGIPRTQLTSHHFFFFFACFFLFFCLSKYQKKQNP